MKCSCVIVFLAFLSLAFSAPFHETDLEEANLQGQLEDEMISQQLAFKEKQDSSAVAESRNADTVLNILQTVLNFAKEKNLQQSPGPATKQKSLASTIQFRQLSAADRPHMLPIDSTKALPQDDLALSPREGLLPKAPGEDMPKALPVNQWDDFSHSLGLSQNTHKHRSSRTQTFLPQEVQDRYNRDDDSEV